MVADIANSHIKPHQATLADSHSGPSVDNSVVSVATVVAQLPPSTVTPTLGHTGCWAGSGLTALGSLLD